MYLHVTDRKSSQECKLCLVWIVNVASSVSLTRYKRIRCQVCVCIYIYTPKIPRCSHLTFSLRLYSSCPMYHLACELMLLSSRGGLCVCGFAQLPRLFPPWSIALAAAAAAAAGLSCPRILFCTFYPKSVQEHCAFSFTVNIVTALTNEKAPEPCLDLNALFGSFWLFWFLRGCHFLHLNPETFTWLKGVCWQDSADSGFFLVTYIFHLKPREKFIWVTVYYFISC